MNKIWSWYGESDMPVRFMRTNMYLVLNLHKKKVKELKYGNDGDAKGEPVDAAKVG